MTNRLLASGAMLLALAATAPAALADGPRASSENNWPGMAHPVLPAAATPAQPPHYEWQQGYDPHGKWRGHWVLVP